MVAHDHAVDARQDILDDLTGGRDGRHRSRVIALDVGGRRHRVAAGARQGVEVGVRQRPGGPQRGELAVAVSQEARGRQAEVAQHRVLAGRQSTDRGLGVVGAPQRLLVRRRALRDRRRRKHSGGEGVRACIGEPGVGRVEGGAHGREVDRGLATHLDVLAALAGEQRGDLELGQRRGAEPDALRVRPVLLIPRAQQRYGQLSQLLGLGVGTGDEPDPGITSGNRAVGGRRVQRGHQRVPVGCVPDVRAGPAVRGTRTLGISLLQHHVEVGPAEAHRRRGGAADRSTRVADPGARRGVRVERVPVESGVRRLDVDRGRQHLVPQRKRELHQARGARGALRVSDL